jgi:tetratricopeptide (TPR) repeat protein
LLATADPLDASYARQRQAGEVLERIFKELPDHPAAAHYIIHAYDCGPLAERALEAAKRYAKSASVVPHAIHMPSHTYVLLGRWRDNIDSNLVGEKAELERGIPEDRLHDIDYLVYGYLQIGEDAKAKQFRDLGLSIEQELVAAKRDVGLRARPFAIAAIEARYALERSSWTEAAALQPRPNRWAFIEAVPHFARAVGASRSGNPAAAKADIDRLTELQADLAKSNITYWARVVDIQLKIASAWMADAEGRSADALSLMQAAADLEKSIDTHDTLSPGPVGATAHESLGELLLKGGRAREALASFEESLKLAKDRARGYFGAAKAAGLAGDADRQKVYVAKLAEVCGVSAATTSPADGTDAQLSMLPCAWLTR